MTPVLQTISNNHLTVQIHPVGAQLWSVQDKEGTEYLWQGDPAYWPDRAINIFPYVARMTDGKYTLNGQTYHMDIHGFAKDMLFEVVSHQTDMIVFHIKETPDTFVQYPYSFDFYITYRLLDCSLIIDFKVVNRNSNTMFFGIGGHPGFCVPFESGLQFEDYYIKFPVSSPSKRVIFSEDCFVMDGQFEPFAPASDGKYYLHHDMFCDDAIILTDMPRTIALASDKGTRQIQVTYPDMPYLGLWHMPNTDAPYICIEPWSSLPSRKGIIEDLAKQADLLSLPAGQTYTNSWKIEIL